MLGCDIVPNDQRPIFPPYPALGGQRAFDMLEEHFQQMPVLDTVQPFDPGGETTIDPQQLPPGYRVTNDQGMDRAVILAAFGLDPVNLAIGEGAIVDGAEPFGQFLISGESLS